MREPDFVDECYADKDLSLLKKLTLVIPTYNRNYYLSRCLWYHAHFPFGEIIVADSSPEEKKVVNRETVVKIREMFGANIRYLEYEPETEKYGGDIYRKWGDAVHHVKTEYSQICTDKEFLIPTTLVKSTSFLDENEEYGSAEGTYHNIVYDINTSISMDTVCKGKSSLPYHDSACRLLSSLISQNSSMNLFALRRTSLHNKVYNTIYKYNLDLRFGEALTELLTLIYSKYQFFPDIPHKYRDTMNLKNSKVGSGSSDLHYPYLNQYISDGVYECYFKKSISCLSNELSQNCNQLTYYDAEKLISDVLPVYLERRGLMGNKSLITKIITNRIGGIIWKYLSHDQKERLKRLIGIDQELRKPKKVEKINDHEYIIKNIMIETMKSNVADQPLNYDHMIPI